jgi:hypothetical protein
MTHEPLERDPALGSALRSVAADPERVPVDWTEMRRTIARQASPELARRGTRQRWMRVAIPTAVAASIALLVLVSRAPEPSVGSAGADRAATAAATAVTVDELLDADVSEPQFRALLFGASDPENLLMIAAAEEEAPSVR